MNAPPLSLKDYLAAALLCLIVGFFFLGSTKNQFESSVERGRYALTQSIVEDKSFIIDKHKDFSFPDVSIHNGHFLSRFPPGMSIALAPVYALSYDLRVNAQYLSFGTVGLLASLMAGVMFLTVRLLGIARPSAMLAVAAIALCSILWPFVGGYWAHPVSALLVAIGLLFAVLCQRNLRIVYVVIFAFSAALAVMVDFPNMVIFGPLAVFVLIQIFSLEKGRGIRLVALAVPLIVIGIGIGTYNSITFGSPLAVGQSAKTSVGTTVKSNFLPVGSWNSSGVFDDRRLFPGLGTLLFSYQRGLFFFAPIVAFSIPGLIFLYRRNPSLAWAISASALFSLVFFSLWQDYWGGWSYGPRYLISILPILCLGLAFSIERYARNPLFLISFLALAAWGLFLNVMGAFVSALLPCPCEGYSGWNSSPFQLFEKIGQNQSNSLVYESLLKGRITLGHFLLAVALVVFLIITGLMIGARTGRKDVTAI